MEERLIFCGEFIRFELTLAQFPLGLPRVDEVVMYEGKHYKVNVVEHVIGKGVWFHVKEIKFSTFLSNKLNENPYQ